MSQSHYDTLQQQCPSLIPAVFGESLYNHQVKSKAGDGGNPQLSITGALHRVNPLYIHLLLSSLSR